MANDQLVRNVLSTLEKYKPEIQERLTGRVETVGDGVVTLSGMYGVSMNEIIEFPHGVSGVVINLATNRVGAIVMGDYLQLQEGNEARNTGQLLSIPVGDAMVGRVVNPLGEPLDGKGEIKREAFYPLERVAPGVMARQSVDTSLATGIKAIDAMIPIGQGQRELIIGDRGTGKTAIALDTIINQKDKNVICIYVAIGQKASRVAQLIETLEQQGAMQHTIVVAANSSDPASLQYLSPYAGCAIGEYFMEKGGNALVVYDDLSKHAWAYRQISLVLRRPSGREAYPGDVFYLHSRLLERACRLDTKHGGGSLTALPIIETLAGDLSAYIPTNVISITDGQIFLEADLFYAGIKPAVNVGNSVSRVGSAAQIKAMKQVAGKLRLDLAQYRSLAAFAQFAGDLDPATKAQIERGARMTEILKQPQYQPLPVEDQVVSIWAGTNGYLDDISVEKVTEFEAAFLEYLHSREEKLLKTIASEKKIDEKTENQLKEIIDGFKEGWKESV